MRGAGGGLDGLLPRRHPVGAARLACAEPDLASAVVYYGGPPRAEQVAAIRCPLRGFYGQDDPRIVQALPAFAEALKAAGVDHELRVYPDAPHAFFNDTRSSYRAEPARDAWARTLAFFAQTLDPVPVVPIDSGHQPRDI